MTTLDPTARPSRTIDLTVQPELCWLDLETTGFGEERPAAILEVGIILTDVAGRVRAEGMWLVWCYPGGYDPEAEHMHRPVAEGGSGLRQACDEERFSLREVDGQISRWLQAHGVDGTTCKPRVAGNSVHFDRGFTKRDLPLVDRLLHHRHVDVTCLLGFFADAGLPLAMPRTRPHRALPDLRQALEHYRALRAALDVLAQVSPGGVVLGPGK